MSAVSLGAFGRYINGKRLEFGIGASAFWRHWQQQTGWQRVDALATSSLLVPTLLALYASYALLNWNRVRTPRLHWTLRVIYNCFMSAFWLVFAAVLGATVWHQVQQTSLRTELCSGAMPVAELRTLYSLATLAHCAELVESTLAAQPLTILYWWHRFATVLLAYMHLIENTRLQWLPLLVSAVGGALMYFYYAGVEAAATAETAPLRPVWTRIIVHLQVVQLATLLIVPLAALFASDSCRVSPNAQLISSLVMCMYLLVSPPRPTPADKDKR